uniref:Uncharacterized protein n=1 Tax=Romanomermis culicivorax TaxID=13658 RepID=A0A915IMI9_ROMCU
SVGDCDGHGRKSEVSFRDLEIIQSALTENPETTTKEMKKIMDDAGQDLGEKTLIRARQSLDESKIQLESFTKKCYRREGCPATLKGKYKHPLSVLIWGGISRKGAAPIVIFTGIMDADF